MYYSFRIHIDLSACNKIKRFFFHFLYIIDIIDPVCSLHIFKLSSFCDRLGRKVLEFIREQIAEQCIDFVAVLISSALIWAQLFKANDVVS